MSAAITFDVKAQRQRQLAALAPLTRPVGAASPAGRGERSEAFMTLKKFEPILMGEP